MTVKTGSYKSLARICKDGVDSICAGVRELEEQGYVIRERFRNPNGQPGAIEYTILVQPRPAEPGRENPERENPSTPTGERMGTDGMGAREIYRELILDNIGYEYLIQDSHIGRKQLDEIAELIVDTVCSAGKTIRIAGDDYLAEVVKSRFMKLDSSHVRYVMDCMGENTTYVRNIKNVLQPYRIFSGVIKKHLTFASIFL